MAVNGKLAASKRNKFTTHMYKEANFNSKKRSSPVCAEENEISFWPCMCSLSTSAHFILDFIHVPIFRVLFHSCCMR